MTVPLTVCGGTVTGVRNEGTRSGKYCPREAGHEAYEGHTWKYSIHLVAKPWPRLFDPRLARMSLSCTKTENLNSAREAATAFPLVKSKVGAVT
jgi:hypothetical protein